MFKEDSKKALCLEQSEERVLGDEMRKAATGRSPRILRAVLLLWDAKPLEGSGLRSTGFRKTAFFAV